MCFKHADNSQYEEQNYEANWTQMFVHKEAHFLFYNVIILHSCDVPSITIHNTPFDNSVYFDIDR